MKLRALIKGFYPNIEETMKYNLPDFKLEGLSLLPLLENPESNWERPALTTHGRENHSIRSERWRYIRYSDGTEELYDHKNDEMEWINLAGKAEFDRACLPST